MVKELAKFRRREEMALEDIEKEGKALEKATEKCAMVDGERIEIMPASVGLVPLSVLCQSIVATGNMCVRPRELLLCARSSR